MDGGMGHGSRQDLWFPTEIALCECYDSLCCFQAAQAQKLEGAAKAAEEAAEEALERAKKAKQIEVRPDSGTWKELWLCEMIEMCKAPRRRNSVSWGIPRTGNKGSLSAEKRNLLPHHKKGWSGTRCFSDFISQRSQFLAPKNEEDAAEAVHQAKVAQQLESEAGGGECIWRTV